MTQTDFLTGAPVDIDSNSHGFEQPTATLGQTWVNPAIALRFTYGARHKTTGASLLEWVKELPGRRWDPKGQRWLATGFGDNPTQMLEDAGFLVDIRSRVKDERLSKIRSLEDLITPVATMVGAMAVIYPRFGGYDEALPFVPAGAAWDRDLNGWRVLPADLVTRTGKTRNGIRVSNSVVAAAKESFSHVSTKKSLRADAAKLASSIGVGTSKKAIKRMAKKVGTVPDWFGLDLFPYQHDGATAMAAGFRLLADEPGSGKTRQALATCSIVDAKRVVVLSPEKVITSWCYETKESGIHNKGGAVDGEVVAIRSAGKQPPLPDRGVVVLTDALISSRVELRNELIEWKPDVVIYDEAHRAKTWDSRRSLAARELSTVASHPLALTGTPLDRSPQELASILEFTRHLTPLFGGYTAFINTYCKENFFKAWVPRMEMLKPLRKLLNRSVWVRRLKKDILPDLPGKFRVPMILDVSLVNYRKAHAELLDKLDLWFEELGYVPDAAPQVWELDENGDRVITQEEGADRKMVLEWAKKNIGMLSPLRKAAGIAKVPDAAGLIKQWVTDHATKDSDGNWSTERPLIVWVHHIDVGKAMIEAALAAVGGDDTAIGSIIGGTTTKDSDAAKDKFQAGKLPVLICSISAAGVGLTLTKGHDILFVEASYTVKDIAQAEDRCVRIGQTQQTKVTTMIAVGTLDERIQLVLKGKGAVLNEILVGGDNNVAVYEGNEDDEYMTPSEIIADLVHLAATRSKRKRKKVTK